MKDNTQEIILDSRIIIPEGGKLVLQNPLPNTYITSEKHPNKFIKILEFNSISNEILIQNDSLSFPLKFQVDHGVVYIDDSLAVRMLGHC